MTPEISELVRSARLTAIHEQSVTTKNCIDWLCDALERSSEQAAQGWQPMDIARLDGKPFLARYQWLGEDQFMVIRRSDKGPWWIMHGTTQVVGDNKGAIRFTHWMPLPFGPPVSGSTEGGK